MTDRRSFISGSAALAAAAAAAPGLASAGRPSGRLYKAVIDTRFAESLGFAREAARAGLPLARIRGDVTDLWFHDLGPRWKAGQAAVAGLTGADALFCLERLAWDANMRVVFRAEHRAVAAGVEHRLTAPDGALADLGPLRRSGRAWPAQAARLALACPFLHARGAATASSACAAPQGPARSPTTPVAPVRRV